ncbi:MAG TPA: hypothetical protein VHK65_04965 [Candidatus Dormibacteraeota bacterium]|nr:hypothetical protein [Candidatus Dormibacteraeota bacterium]
MEKISKKASAIQSEQSALASANEQDLIGRARADEEQLGQRMRELELELTAVEERLSKIRAFIELFSQYARPADASQPPPKDLANMTIADASAAILRSLGGEARLTELIKTLRRAGKLPTNSRGAYATLVQTLKRYPKRFERERAGVWKLVEDVEVTADSSREGQYTLRFPGGASVVVGGDPSRLRLANIWQQLANSIVLRDPDFLKSSRHGPSLVWTDPSTVRFSDTPRAPEAAPNPVEEPAGPAKGQGSAENPQDAEA